MDGGEVCWVVRAEMVQNHWESRSSHPGLRQVKADGEEDAQRELGTAFDTAGTRSWGDSSLLEPSTFLCVTWAWETPDTAWIKIQVVGPLDV